MHDKNKTISGTDIEEVKRLNGQSGLTYNEAKEALARKKEFSSSPITNREQ